jgi:hypothetical protein
MKNTFRQKKHQKNLKKDLELENKKHFFAAALRETKQGSHTF